MRDRYGMIDEYGDTVHCEDCNQLPAQETVLVEGKPEDGTDDWRVLCHECKKARAATAAV